MSIINLKLDGKQVTGDGTKIVCMNDDYVVHIECNNCDSFMNLQVKKLILKEGMDYRESTLVPVTYEGENILRANLPAVGFTKSVELGVCGKDTEDGDPKYTSQPVTFECVKSILCGAVVPKKDPTLDSLDVKENGIYTAAEKNVDGFYEVKVSIPGASKEIRKVDLSMAGGSQLIEPSNASRLMEKVVVTKPASMIPENIRAGISIGGVVGNYDKVLTELEVFADGDYTPPEGFDGFSKVFVKVDSATEYLNPFVGQHFTYEYDHHVSISMDTPGIIRYENTGESVIFTVIDAGICSITLRDFDKDSNLVRTVHYAVNASFEAETILPKEANDLVALDKFLKDGVIGGIIKYTGVTTDGFVNGGLYVIAEEEY